MLLLLSTVTAYAQVLPDGFMQTAKQDTLLHIGFAKQPSRFTSASISTVKGSELQRSFQTNLGSTLFGRIPGLTVMAGSNEPGANAPAINGRGIGTLGTGRNLLIIVDGFIGDYNQLVAEEVEEISLLKDASATAIYGSRAANGVLLVTTKRGKDAPLQVNFSTRQGFTQATGLPKFLGSLDYATLYNEALSNIGQPARYSDADLEAYKTGSDPYFHPDVNWYNEVLRKSAPVSDFNLSFRGGNSTAKYFVLLNNISNQGLYKNFGDMDEESRNSTYNRFNFRANIDVNLTKRLSATLLLGGTVEDKANAATLNTNNIFNQLSLLPPNAFPVRNPDGSFASNTTYSNPVATLIKTGYAESNGRTLQSSFRINEDLGMITPGLSASAAISFNNYFRSGSNRTKNIQTFTWTKNAAGDTLKNISGTSTTTSLTGTEPNLGQYRNFALQGFLNYHRLFGKHDISATAVFNADNSTIDKSDIYTTTNTANLTLAYKNNSAGARVTYVNNGKYILEYAMSYMGSENYAPGRRYGYFPAVSAGYVISNENFMKESSTVNFLKLRASYGLTGNDEIGGTRFMYYQTYPFGASYFFGTGSNTASSSLSEGRLANRDVTWEKDKKLNIGLDASFIDRIDVSIDLFKQTRSDILVAANRTIPLYLGYTDLPMINLGEVENRGFEASVRYHNPETAKLRFFAQGNVWYARNKIIYDAQVVQVNPGQVSAGTRIGQPFGLNALGLFATDAEAAASARPIGITAKAGDVKYEDIGGPLGVPDGVIDGNDSRAIGNPGLPDLNFGFQTGLAFHGFDLDLNFQGVSGNTVNLSANQFRPFQNNGQAGVIAMERWTPATAATAIFPRLTADNNQNNYRFSTFYQRDGSFLKLRSAELGYAFSSPFLTRKKVNLLRLFITGTNLFSLDHISYGDPEALGVGYPAYRTLTFGARIQL